MHSTDEIPQFEKTPLCVAVEEDATNTIPMLVERGADVTKLLPRARERARVIARMLHNLKEDSASEEWVFKTFWLR